MSNYSMKCENIRSPSKYHEFRNVTWNTNPKQIQNRYDTIQKNYDTIINLLSESNYVDIHDLFFGYKIDNKTAKENLTRNLIYYCIDNNDIKMMSKLFRNNFFDNSDAISSLIFRIVDETKFDMFKYVIDTVKPYSTLNEKNMSGLAEIIATKIKKNPIIFYEIIMQYGYKFDDNIIKLMMFHNNIVALQYAINNGYDIQTVFDNEGNTIHFNNDMLKFLYNTINISKYSKNIYEMMFNTNDLDSIIFLVDNFPELDLKDGLNKACANSNIEIMKYFLGKGLNIEDIVLGNYNLKYKTIKFLIDCGYPTDKIDLNNVLLRVFVFDNIEKVYYLHDNGANISCIINEKLTNPKNFFVLAEIYNSPIEQVIMKGKIEHIKFLIDNYYDIIKPKLNNMFVIACANGKIDIAKYLLEFDIEIHIKALISACFFGHLNIVKMLLELGQSFDDVDENLFDVVIWGNSKPEISKCYDRLIDDDIFKNDVYEYGKDHYAIIQILMEYKISVGKCDFIEKINENMCKIDFYKYIVMNVEEPNGIFGGKTLLESATYLGNVEVINMLLECGVNFIRETVRDFNIDCL